MRIYFLLILTAISLSFSTAYFALNLEKNNVASEKDSLEIKALQKAFVNFTKVEILLDLSSMYPTRDFFQLLNPISIYSNNDRGSMGINVSSPCHKNAERMSRLAFDKNQIWEDFRCLRLPVLPANFFESPPLIHDNGGSFAYLAFLLGREPFNSLEWVRSNIHFFHVSELKLLAPGNVEGPFRVLALLSKNNFEEILRGEKHLLTKDFYLVKNDSAREIKYSVYRKNLFDEFFSDKSYYVKAARAGEPCFFKDGGLCFEKVSLDIWQIFKRSSIMIFLTSVLVLFLIAIILFKKIGQQKHEEERKKHALRVLTHELRTPVSNLLLQVEMINKQSDIIPPQLLEDFLKIESEVYRLKRLAEKSSSYLQTHEGRSLFALESNTVSSINELVTEMLDHYSGKYKIELIPLVKDQEIRVDVYWLSICLKNLVENAFLHGSPPVTVKISDEKEFLRIDVINSGDCPFSSLEEMIKSERVGKSGSGLGVGLSIVERIMREMKGKLTFSNHPTVFSLYLRKIL